MKITRFALVLLLVSAFSLSAFSQDSTKTAPSAKAGSHKMAKGAKMEKSGAKMEKKGAKLQAKGAKKEAKGAKMKAKGAAEKKAAADSTKH
jgi:hypothetical protein